MINLLFNSIIYKKKKKKITTEYLVKTVLKKGIGNTFLFLSLNFWASQLDLKIFSR